MGRRAHTSLGANDLTAAQAVAAVVSDPYLTEVSCHVLRLAAIERGERPPARCQEIPVVPATIGKGIGLRYVVRPLRVAVAAREHPYYAAGVVTAVVGGIFLLGYAVGKGARRA
jgi:hypothetical protein